MSNRDGYKFRLFVADSAPNSSRAIENLTRFCNTYLEGQHEIEVIDVLKDPRRGLAEGIIMTPTLVKLSPSPLRRIIGILSDTQVLRDAVGLDQLSA